MNNDNPPPKPVGCNYLSVLYLTSRRGTYFDPVITVVLTSETSATAPFQYIEVGFYLYGNPNCGDKDHRISTIKIFYTGTMASWNKAAYMYV